MPIVILQRSVLLKHAVELSQQFNSVVSFSIALLIVLVVVIFCCFLYAQCMPHSIHKIRSNKVTLLNYFLSRGAVFYVSRKDWLALIKLPRVPATR